MEVASTSPGSASDCTRWHRFTAMPVTSASMTSTSPVWTPARPGRPREDEEGPRAHPPEAPSAPAPSPVAAATSSGGKMASTHSSA